MSLFSTALLGKRILVAEPIYLLAMEIRDSLQKSGAIVLGPVRREEQALAILDDEDVDATLFNALLDHNQMPETLAHRLTVGHLPSLLLGYLPLPAGHRLRFGRPQLLYPASTRQIERAVQQVLI